MKEATGELNATVIVILAVGILVAFFYYTIWPLIKGNYDTRTNCDNAICDNQDADKDGFVECHLKGKTETFTCVYKG